MKHFSMLFLTAVLSIALFSCKKSGGENQTYEVVTVGFEVSYGKADLKGKIGPDARIEDVTQVGFLYSEDENVVWNTENCNDIACPSVNKDFSANLSINTYDILYFFRAYCIMGGEMYMGTVKSFRSKGLAPTGITVSKTSIGLVVGGQEKLTATVLPEGKTAQDVNWETSDAKVASVSGGLVKAVATGMAVITVTSPGLPGKSGKCIVSVRNAKPAGAVDMGFGPYWAEKNLGASKVGDYGDFYAWGETNTRSTFYESDYRYSDHRVAVLSASSDAASVKLGSRWRMPTKEEAEQLRDNCTFTVETVDGHKGVRCTSKINGNSIFLPAAGSKSESLITGYGWYNEGSAAMFWTSTANPDDSNRAYDFTSSLSNVQDQQHYSAASVYSYYKYCGYTIRPVSD